MQAGDVFEALDHSRRSIVAPQNLAGFPALAGIVQRHPIPQRLVHVQPQRMIDLRHISSGLHDGYAEPSSRRSADSGDDSSLSDGSFAGASAITVVTGDTGSARSG